MSSSTQPQPDSHLQEQVARHYDAVWEAQEDESWNNWAFFRQKPSALDSATNALAIQPGVAILDLACGIGQTSQKLAEWGASVFSLDISVEGLRKTAQRASQLNLSQRIHPVLASVEVLPFADNSFNGVLAQNFLMHVDPGTVGREVARVLKPGGVAVFVEPLSHHPLIKLYRRFFSEYKDTHPRWTTRTELEQLAAPFSQVRLRQHYLLSAVASVGAIQKRRWLLKPIFASLNAIDHTLLRFFPTIEKYGWVAVLELKK